MLFVTEMTTSWFLTRLIKLFWKIRMHSRTFHKKLLDAGMTQSMSRVGRCIDNGPMEGFWGILKRECYYGHTFTSREQLISTIESYIDYYNNRRYQHRLFIQTPMQAHVSAMNRAA